MSDLLLSANASAVAIVTTVLFLGGIVVIWVRMGHG